jgi:amino-acid N-acetyltransferase
MPKGVINGVDFQFSGKVRKISDANLVQALNNNAIVVISSLGYSLTGEIFNIPASEVASEVAIALGADKLITFIKSDGLFDKNQQLVRQIRVSQCPNYFNANNENHGHIISSLKSAYTVCNRGVPRAQMVNFTESGALLGELFTREGRGTLVHSDSYEEIRPATIDDVGGILGLIEPLEEQGILVRRSRELLEREINQFFILELDGTIIGCAGLYSFGDSNIGELACVATHPNHQGHGYAQKLLSKIETEAKNLGFNKLFVLTTQTAHWFIEQGFKPANISDLPAQKQSAYNFQRLSKAFIKFL